MARKSSKEAPLWLVALLAVLVFALICLAYLLVVLGPLWFFHIVLKWPYFVSLILGLPLGLAIAVFLTMKIEEHSRN